MNKAYRVRFTTPRPPRKVYRRDGVPFKHREDIWAKKVSKEIKDDPHLQVQNLEVPAWAEVHGYLGLSAAPSGSKKAVGPVVNVKKEKKDSQEKPAESDEKTNEKKK